MLTQKLYYGNHESLHCCLLILIRNIFCFDMSTHGKKLFVWSSRFFKKAKGENNSFSQILERTHARSRKSMHVVIRKPLSRVNTYIIFGKQGVSNSCY